MPRYVDADALIKDAVKESNQDGAYGYMDTKSIVDLINDAPTADVVERKRGKWKQGYCSECGYNWGKDAPIASVPNFCPNCGAQMDERKDDE